MYHTLHTLHTPCIIHSTSLSRPQTGFANRDSNPRGPPYIRPVLWSSPLLPPSLVCPRTLAWDVLLVGARVLAPRALACYLEVLGVCGSDLHVSSSWMPLSHSLGSLPIQMLVGHMLVLVQCYTVRHSGSIHPETSAGSGGARDLYFWPDFS